MRSNAVLLTWFSVLFVLMSVSVLFSPSICLDGFSYAMVAVWPPFGKELHIGLSICSVCIMSICYFGCFPLWFRGLDCGSNCASFWSLLIFYLPVKPA